MSGYLKTMAKCQLCGADAQIKRLRDAARALCHRCLEVQRLLRCAVRMKAKPISFTPEVLKAKLRALEAFGRCQTRKPLSPQPVVIDADGGGRIWRLETQNGFITSSLDGTWPITMTRAALDQDGNCWPPVAPLVDGQRLWVRERALVKRVRGPAESLKVLLGYADGGKSMWLPYPARLRPPREGHCIANGVFREGARHFLEVVEVRVERVAQISAGDCVLEGINPSAVPGLGGDEPLRSAYFAIYDSIYGEGAHSRDWCWVYTLKRATP